MTMRLPDGRDLPLYDPTKGLPETPGGFQFSAPLPAPPTNPDGQAEQAAAIQKSGGYGSPAPAPVVIAPPKAAEPAAPTTEQPIVVHSQGYTTPAGWVPGQRSARGVAYDPEAMQALREARQTQAQDQAIAAQEKAGPTGEFARDAFAAQQEERRLRTEAETAQVRADESRAEIRRRLAEVEKDHAALQGDKVDPSRFWTDRSAFTTAINVAAMAMGEYARILGRSGSNTAADMIDAQIQRDIDAQKANIELRRQGVRVKETLLDRYMQTNDPERSEQLARATLREAAAAEIAKNKAIAGKADTLALVSDLRNKAAITIAEQDAESTKREVSGTEAYQQARTVGGGAVAIDPRIMRELKIPEALWPTKFAQQAQQQYMSSQATAAGTAEGKGEGAGKATPYGVEAAKNLSLAEGLQKNIKTLQDAIRKDGRNAVLMMNIKGTTLNNAVTNASDQLGRLRSGAAVTDAEAKRFSQLMGGSLRNLVKPDIAIKSMDQLSSEAQGIIGRLAKAPGQASAPEPTKEIGIGTAR